MYCVIQLEDLMRPDEVAKIEQVTRQNVYSRIKTGHIPVRTKTKRVQVHVEQYLEENPDLVDLYDNPEKYCTIEKLQNSWDMSESSIRRYIKDDCLKVVRLPSKGHKLIRVRITIEDDMGKQRTIDLHEFCLKTGANPCEVLDNLKKNIYPSTDPGMIDLDRLCHIFPDFRKYFPDE